MPRRPPYLMTETEQARHARYERDRARERYAERRERGVCVRCGGRVQYKRSMCMLHLSLANERVKRSQARSRALVLG